MRIKGKSNAPFPIREEQSDESLVAQVAQGDSAALEALYDRYAPVVLGLVMKVNADQEAAEDILQETFWRVWRYAGTYQPQLGSFAAWMFRIARNLAVDLHRRQSARPQAPRSDEPEDMDQTPDPNAEVLEQTQSSFRSREVHSAVATLPAEQRQVIEMAYFLGMTRQEIADATGESLGTIHTRARLGLQKLRRELEKVDFEG
ncbi:MAG: sigma-70 family RNA polymerase sigma factor [Chloroflexota bacterium]